MSRRKAESKGRSAEVLAAWWLRLQGWRILARRQRLGVGEVDIIARRGRTVAFVEVKWRNHPALLRQAVDVRRLHRVVAAAQGLAHRFAGPQDDLRVDVILIAPWRLPRRITNVWQPDA
ncbi:YraN family protein [Novosphingobium sp. FKTRR1]|uniref:YraN family protein n=1 Tax=unclassified Novosphingobium TaxID=2644732 RepID=UPI001CF09553|nr:YraN family protein [Novosphingobium sp. FKTRR1]